MRIIYFYFIVYVLLSSCGDCENVKIGEIAAPAYFKEYAVHEHGEIVSFEDANGNNQEYTVERLDQEGEIPGKFFGTMSSSDGIMSCYEYYSIELPLLQYFQKMGQSILIVQMGLSDNNDAESGEEITSSVLFNHGSYDGVNSGGAQGFYNISEDKNISISDETSFEKLDQWKGNNKTYQNVLHYYKDTGDVYFSVGHGIIAYVGYDGVLWTLKE